MLYRRLVLLNTVVLVLLVAALVLFNIDITDELIKNEVYGTFEHSMDTGADDMARVFSQAKDLALEISVLDTVQSTLRSGMDTACDPVQVLNQARSQSKDVVRLISFCEADLMLSDGKGDFLLLNAEADAVDSLKEQNEALCTELAASVGGFVWDYHYNEYGSYVRVSRLIYNEENWTQVIGAVSIRINSDYLRSMLSSVYLGPAGTACLLDENGELLFPYVSSHVRLTDVLLSGKESEPQTQEDGTLLFSRSLYPNGFRMVGIAQDVGVLERMNKQRIMIVLFAVFLLACAIVMTLVIAYRISNPIIRLASTMKKLEAGDFSVRLPPPEGKGEIHTLYTNFNSMLDMRESLIEEVYGSRVREKEAELLSLQAQINPHFLYNTLDSISWMAAKYDAEDIEEAVSDLALMLRYSLNNGMNILTVGEELIQIKSYIKLQRMRFSNSFSVQYDVDPEVLDCLMIKLLLQPLVENSLLHGFDDIDYVGNLQIRIQRVPAGIQFEVINDGNLVDLEKIRQALMLPEDNRPKSYGIRNVNDRLVKYYGPESCLKFSVNGIYSVASFTIPEERRTPNGPQSPEGPDSGR